MTEISKHDEKKQIKTDVDLLVEIKDILVQRLPKKCPIWKSKKLYMPLLLLLSLSIVDLEFGKRANCDIVVTEGTKIDLVKMPEPNWAKLGIEMNSEYWKVSEPNGILVFFDISLVRQGLTYNQSFIKVKRERDKKEGKAVLMDQLIIKCPTTILVEPCTTDSEDNLIRKQVIRTYSFRIGHNEIPLGTFINYNTYTGKLVVLVKPRIGWRRFKANLSTAFSFLS